VTKEIAHNKLVRDKIIDIIEDAGKTAIWHIAEDLEYETKLYEKVIEEVAEFKNNPSEEEAADILEVIYSLISYYGLNLDVIEATRKKKAEGRGSFKCKIVLESVIQS